MIRISNLRLAAFLVAISCLLAVAGALVEWERLLGGHARLLGLEPLLDAGDEANLPTWWQSALLAAGALVAAAVAARTSRVVRTQRWRWCAVSACLLVLSLAEGAALDQRAAPLLDRLRALPAGRFGSAPFVFAALALALAAFAPLLRPFRGARMLLAIAGLTWVAGAVGMQWLQGAWGAHHAVASAGFLALHVGEELGESLGATFAVVALVAELGARGGIRLAIE